MTNDNKDDPNKKPGIIDLTKYKATKNSGQSSKLPQPVEGQPGVRRYMIELENDVLEIEGILGLSPSFLVIGDEMGRVIFGVAQGSWKFISDITDEEAMLEEFLADLPEDPNEPAN